MSPQAPWLLRLSRRLLARRDHLAHATHTLARASALDPLVLHHAFAFKSDEHAFARALVERAPQWRLYRTHQQRRCGDFAAVDLSPPDPRRRVVRVIELKRDTALQHNRGAGMQLTQADALGAPLAALGVVVAECPVETLVGDADAVLAHLARLALRPSSPARNCGTIAP